jgi:hypothetical protein
MTDNKILAESGMVIGVRGAESLHCPVCQQPLVWYEHNVEARVKEVDGILVPEEEKPADMGRASPKEAVCCNVLFKLEPWAAYTVSTMKLEE